MGGALRRRDGAAEVAWRLSGVAAAAVPTLCLAVLAVLAVEAWPSVLRNGLSFFWRARWRPGDLRAPADALAHGLRVPAGVVFGVLPYVAGTAVSAGLALIIALPIGVGVAIVLADRASGRLGVGLDFLIDLVAGVPSVVFGLWGLVVVVPWIAHGAGPPLARLSGFIPWLRGPVLSGTGLLASVVVLAAMVVPLVAALSRDAIARVPQALREQGRALGLTEWEILRGLVLPAAAPAIAGGAMLALGRALGEAIAVLMVSGRGIALPTSIFSPISTMASALLADLGSALHDPQGMAVHALAELAMVLLMISVLVHLAARLADRGVSRVRAVFAPRGRGL